MSMAMEQVGEKRLDRAVEQLSIVGNIVCIALFSYRLNAEFGGVLAILETVLYLMVDLQLCDPNKLFFLAVANSCEILFIMKTS